MQRIALDEGGWFDASEAIEFREGTYWNGSNHISRATESQWEHEFLYLTRHGRWILQQTSQRQGSKEFVREIDNEQAVCWLVRNERDQEAIESLAEFPSLLEMVHEALAKTEV